MLSTKHKGARRIQPGSPKAALVDCSLAPELLTQAGSNVSRQLEIGNRKSAIPRISD